MNVPPALELRQIRSGYGSTQVIHGVDLRVADRGVTALLGLNGAGKTALLRAVVGLERVAAGTIRLFGQQVTTSPPHRRQRLGLAAAVGQGVFDALTVGEHLALAAGTTRRDAPQLAEVLDSFPLLTQRWRQRAATMSGGERQMLSLARALVSQPRLLVLDEPSAGLSPSITEGLYAALRRWRTDHDTAVLIAEQQPQWLAGLVDDAVVMTAGTIGARLTAAQVRDGGGLWEALRAADSKPTP